MIKHVIYRRGGEMFKSIVFYGERGLVNGTRIFSAIN